MTQSKWVRGLTTLLVTSVAAALLASCGAATPGTDPTTPAASGEPAPGGALTYLEPQTWNTLYPPSAGFYPNGGIVNNVRVVYWHAPLVLDLPTADITKYQTLLNALVTAFGGAP